MSQEAFPQPGADTYNAVVSAIGELQQSGQQHITICWPTTTTALFMRRRLMVDLNGTFAIRNTTSRELLSLIKDATVHSAHYRGAQSIAEWEILASITRQLFPRGSAWRKVQLVDETLKVVSEFSEEQFRYVENNFPLASRCRELYYSTSTPTPPLESNNVPIDIEHLVGSCILVGYERLDEHSSELLNDFPKHISYRIISNEQSHTPDNRDVHVFSQPSREIDAMFVDIVNELSQSSPSSTLIIVPNNSYKRAVLASARVHGIPVSGSSPTTLGEHEFITCAHALLHSGEATTQDAREFLERFTWLSKNEQQRGLTITQYKECVESLTSATTLAQYFAPITQFIEKNLCIEHFTTSDEEQSHAQRAFAILLDCAQSHEACSDQDALFVLEMVSSKPLREEKMGDGIYVAQANEVLGCYVGDVFAVGLHDRYIEPSAGATSLINRDQYSLLGLPDSASSKDQARSTMRWLLNSSDNLHLYSSTHDLGGKEVTLPSWAHEVMCLDVDLTNTIDVPEINDMNTFLVEALGSTATTSNIAYTRDPPSHMRATSIETLAQCPARYFNRHVLRIEDTYETDNPDFLEKKVSGTHIHRLLENYVFHNQSPEELHNALQDLLLTLHENNELPHLASIPMNENRMRVMIDNFLALMADRTATSSDVESKVSGTFSTGKRDVTVSGSIDRTDHYSDNRVRLIDYKTGDFRDKTSVEFYHFGRRLQLAIYACLSRNNFSVTGVDYWYLADASKNQDSYEYTPELLDDAGQLIEDILSITDSGIFPARDINISHGNQGVSEKSPCTHCEYDSTCYSEFRNLWSSVALSKDTQRYVRATSALGSA